MDGGVEVEALVEVNEVEEIMDVAVAVALEKP